MASVTFPTEYGGSGITITDDADPTTGLDGTGYIERFVPALQQGLAMTGHAVLKAGEADSSAQTATSAAQQASADRDSINLDLQTLNGLVSDADASAVAAAGSATTASNMADAVAQATATYTSVSAGLADTVDTNYFRVIEAPEAERVSVYRNDAGSATLITTYYTKTGVDARQAAAVRLNRSLQRLGDHGQTLHSDFDLDAHGLGTALVGGVQDALDSGELWTTVRETPTLAYQHTADGALKYVEVPPNVLAREWNPETGRYHAQDYGAIANELLWATKFDESAYFKSRSIVLAGSSESPIEGRSVFILSEESTTGIHEIVSNTNAIPPTNVSCYSVIVRAREISDIRLLITDQGSQSNSVVASFDLASRAVEETVTGAGQVFESGVLDLGDGYCRCYVSGIPNISGSATKTSLQLVKNGVVSYAGDGTSGLFIAHAQLVEGDKPGPVIVTEDAPVTRAADNIGRSLGAEFDAREGVFLWKGVAKTPGGANFTRIFNVSDGTASNRYEIFRNTAGTVDLFVTPGNLTLGINPQSDNVIIALRYSLSSLSLFVNGVKADLIVDQPEGLSELRLGYSTVPGNLNGSVEFIKCSPLLLSDVQLQELTTP